MSLNKHLMLVILLFVVTFGVMTKVTANCPLPEEMHIEYGGHLIYASSEDGTYWNEGRESVAVIPEGSTFIFRQVMGSNSGSIKYPEYRFDDAPPSCAYMVTTPDGGGTRDLVLKTHHMNFILDNSNHVWETAGGGYYGYGLMCEGTNVNDCPFFAVGSR